MQILSLEFLKDESQTMLFSLKCCILPVLYFNELGLCIFRLMKNVYHIQLCGVYSGKQWEGQYTGNTESEASQRKGTHRPVDRAMEWNTHNPPGTEDPWVKEGWWVILWSIFFIEILVAKRNMSWHCLDIFTLLKIFVLILVQWKCTRYYGIIQYLGSITI